jgi:cathepsin D
MPGSIRVCGVALALVSACSGDDGPKNDGPPPPAFPLNEEQGAAYTVNITIGGSQAFDVVVDTGSTTLAIAGSACSDCTGVTPLYTPGATAMDLHTTSTSTYGDGTSWSAENYSDQVAVTGDTAVPVKLAVIDSESGFFRTNEPAEGILGFGAPELAVSGTDAFVADRMTAGLPTVFAFQLCPENGTLWFGGADKTHEVSDEQYTALAPITDQQPFYLIDVSSAAIGGTSIGFTGQALTDTGTSVMLFPTASYNAMVSAITSSEGYKATFGSEPFPTTQCSLTTSHSKSDIDSALPPMTVTLNDLDGKPFTLSLPATSSYLKQFLSTYCSGIADGGTAPADPVPFAVLGDTFLQAFITVFDTENLKIGFAPQKNCTFPTAREAPTGPWVPYLHGHPWRR